jgi:hypothetical protein
LNGFLNDDGDDGGDDDAYVNDVELRPLSSLLWVSLSCHEDCLRKQSDPFPLSDFSNPCSNSYQLTV